MSAPEELPLPSLEQLQAWDTDHFFAIADWCDAEAARLVNCFEGIHGHIRLADWEGEARDNAVHSSGLDLGKVRAAAEGLTESAKMLRLLGENEGFAKTAALRHAEEASEAGYTVNSDLTVSDPTEYTSWDQAKARQDKAREFAEDIRYEVTSLVRIDRDLAAKLKVTAAPLGKLRFDDVPGQSDGRHGHVRLVGNEKHRWTDQDLYPHDPTAADVHQDRIGDCYLDATMGAIANANPQWIKDRVHYDDKTGNFDVTLWDGHQWKHIAVTQSDIETDIAKSGASWLDNGQPNASLWPSVLESAYAKSKAPGDNLGHALDTVIGKGGYAQDAMEALTGNRGTNINPETVWFTNQHIDQAISGALANHQPVTISTTPRGVPLEHSHVYVVEGISGTGSDAQVTLRNPWETNLGTPIDTPDPLVTVRLGDLIGSGLPGRLDNSQFGNHPTSDVNIGSLG